MGSAQRGSLAGEKSDSTERPLSAADGARLAATIDNWKRRLLDITKRNKALNFRPNKITTITIADEQPAEVFRQLFIRGRQMRFAPTAQATAPSFPADSGQEEALEGADESAPALDFVPYDESSLKDQYTDDVLQTLSPPEKLDQSLRRIDEQARTSLEEQGVNTLFLALGMLHYRESPESEEEFRAPLILLPVELNRRSA